MFLILIFDFAAKRFKCELCTAVYKNLTTLRHHIKQYHAGEFPLHCEKCGSGIANHEAVPLHRCVLFAFCMIVYITNFVL